MDKPVPALRTGIASLRFACVLGVLALSACGGGGGSGSSAPPPPQSFTVGGTVSALNGTVVLQNNGANNLSIAANGTFTFSGSVSSGAAYNVTVLTQPAGQTCVVASGSGTATANVTGVSVNCTTNTYTIGGALSGLNGTVILQNNGGNDLSLAANGGFAFTTPVANGAPYNVTVLTQPGGQTCTVTQGSGNASANVTNVAVACATNTYTISGTITGLSGTVVLQNNLGDNLSVNGATFTFQHSVAANQPYFVSVLMQPPGQTCAVTNFSGTATANVTDVAVACANNPSTFAIGVNVSGLGSGGSLVLQNNGGDDLTATENKHYAFATPLAEGAPYVVTVLTPPAGQICSVVANATGSVSPVSGANDVNVICENVSPPLPTVGGTISGLTGTGLQLYINANNQALPVAANAPTFAFPNGLPTGDRYGVDVIAQPAGQTCVATKSHGVVGTANVTDVAVTCIDNTTDPLAGTYAISGTGAFVTFYPDGIYALATRENSATCGANNGNGVELGVYSYNKATGAFAIESNVVDTNGACGVWDAGTTVYVGTSRITGSGQDAVLTFTPSLSSAVVRTLSPVPSVAASLVGSHAAPLSRGFLVFGNDGHFLDAEFDLQPADLGIEYGCYTQTGSTSGTITPDLSTATCTDAVDTNGTAGLSGKAVPIEYSVLTPYSTQLGSGADAVSLTRILPD